LETQDIKTQPQFNHYKGKISASSKASLMLEHSCDNLLIGGPFHDQESGRDQGINALEGAPAQHHVDNQRHGSHVMTEPS
jgi:hypothetical protein